LSDPDDALSARLLALGERYLTHKDDKSRLKVWQFTYRDGLTNAQIAEELQITPRQVSNLRTSARRLILLLNRICKPEWEPTPYELARVWIADSHDVLPACDQTLLGVLRRSSRNRKR